MPPRSKANTKSIAKDEGYAVIGDTELRQIVEGRIRQLEAERAGHRMTLVEQEADPHLPEPTEDEEQAPVDGPVHPIVGTRRTIESLEARLATLYDRLAALKANTAKDDEEPTS